MDFLLRELYRTFGLKTKIIAPLIGRYALNPLEKEEDRLGNERTYEPRSFYEKNATAVSLETADPVAPEHVEQICHMFDGSIRSTQPVRRARVIAVDPIEIQSKDPFHPKSQVSQSAMKFQSETPTNFPRQFPAT